mmetsp:Transcript_33249/g.66156  ORF Transcript_33249/g.66156 Transcript_33249/m.66156 type:complete len:331 (+) Transcript_33249:595-1587(+)
MMSSAPSSTSSSYAAAPLLIVEQSSPSSRVGSSEMLLVERFPAATREPKPPSVSASKAPMARAHLSLEGERKIIVGRSISESSKAAAKAVWHVASIHEKLSGPPALRLRSLVSISRWLSLLLFSGAPSSSAIAHKPPLFVQTASKFSAESSGRGPLMSLPLSRFGAWPASLPLSPAALLPLPVACARIETTDERKFAMLPKLNLPWCCGMNCIPVSCTWPVFSSTLLSSGNITSNVGAFGLLKRWATWVSEACAMPKPSLPSKARETARIRGGTVLLSEKRMQKAFASAVIIPSCMNLSMLAAWTFSTIFSGSESSATFFTALMSASDVP